MAKRDPVKAKKYRTTFAAKNPTYYRDLHVERAYGITIDDINTIVDLQGGCALCRSMTSGSLPWHVDHNHATGKIRGIICHNCNCILGFAKDSIETLQRAIRYLEENNGSTICRELFKTQEF